jgi:Predicted nucleotide-binding protein containing TIR-like domain
MTPVLNTKQVFVGSSTEGKPFAEAVIDSLEQAGFLPLAWFDFFKSDRPPLQELEQLTLRADAAVLVASADDRAIIRGKDWHQARDNVLFEYGLFAGAIGRPKCGLILPEREDFRIPSDFLGVACFETYTPSRIAAAAGATVKALVSTVQKPQPPQTTQIRGRRLLLLASWIRDEALRLINEWDGERAGHLVESRVIAVSGFLQEDIDQLELRREYQDVEKALVDIIQNFPDAHDRHLDRREMEYAMRSMARGSVPASSEVMGGILYELSRHYDLRKNDCECHRFNKVCDFFLARDRRWPGYWPYSQRYDDHCSLWAYALGAAEATTVFEEMSRESIRRLKRWSEHYAPPLNSAMANLERKLHEKIFGQL